MAMSMLHYHIRISTSESLKQLSDFFVSKSNPAGNFRNSIAFSAF